MNPPAIEIEGTLQADGQLVLDEKPALPPGRVRVALQPIADEASGGADVLAVLLRIRADQKARGHVGRTRQAIDAALDAMRAEDDERMQAIEKLQQECQRTRRATSSSETA